LRRVTAGAVGARPRGARHPPFYPARARASFCAAWKEIGIAACIEFISKSHDTRS